MSIGKMKVETMLKVEGEVSGLSSNSKTVSPTSKQVERETDATHKTSRINWPTNLANKWGWPRPSWDCPGYFEWYSRLTLPLGRFSRVVVLGLDKGSRKIRLFGLPQGKNNPEPVVRQSSKRDTMAFTLGSLAPVVSRCPFFFLGRLPGELVQGITQRFDTGVTAMSARVIAALEGYGRSPGDRL